MISPVLLTVERLASGYSRDACHGRRCAPRIAGGRPAGLTAFPASGGVGMQAEDARALAGLSSGDGPLSIRVRPSSLKRDCDRRTTSTGEKSRVNVHAKSRLTLEPLRTLRPEDKGQAGACPDRTRAIPCKVRAVTAEVSMIRNMRGMILAIRGTSDRVQGGSAPNSLDRRDGLRSRERYSLTTIAGH